ncbi:hypothetical protein KHA80_02110 [Anaerobacillus sp. HL2]|nr:hypothetical protein KHA80_02110 [Anaerobacillus sp. HL2]
MGIVKLVGSSDYFQFQYSSNQLKVAKIKNDASIEPCIILIGVDVEVETITASFHESFNKHT